MMPLFRRANHEGLCSNLCRLAVSRPVDRPFRVSRSSGRLRDRSECSLFQHSISRQFALRLLGGHLENVSGNYHAGNIMDK